MWPPPPVGVGRARPLDALEVARHGAEVEVFNVTVAGVYNSFAEGLLVHNKQPADCTLQQGDEVQHLYSLDECCAALERGDDVTLADPTACDEPSTDGGVDADGGEDAG